MVNNLLDLLRILSIPDVIKVTLVTLATLGQFVWEEVLHQRQLDNIVVDILHTNLSKWWDVDELDILDLLQFLLAL